MRAFLSKKINLSILSGLLFVVSFPKIGGIFPLVFIAWVPLLITENQLDGEQKSGWKVFIYAYLTFFIYNLGTTWWIVFASIGGAMMAFFANSLLMAIAFVIYHLLNKHVGRKWWPLSLIAVWLTFELLHFHWELSWPWLTLGNIFASANYLVQWYSVTGVFGGSLWILLVNIAVYKAIENKSVSILKRSISPILLLLLPTTLSFYLYVSNKPGGRDFNVTVVQPNIDPYNEKFSSSNEQQLQRILNLAKHVKLNQNYEQTALIIAPETALYPSLMASPSDYLVEDNLRNHPGTKAIQEFQKSNKVAFLIGGSTYAFFNEPHSPASEYDSYSNQYVENYNSSILFDLDKAPQVIHKSKLVLGVEKTPFISTIPFLKNWAIDLGGTTGTLGIADHPSVFKTQRSTFAPVVCYESIYGEFVSEQCKQDAGFIAIITNDGWWQDTPGYKQHFLFAGLRAIENNRWVVRSANTGTSGIIDNRGKVIVATEWWQETAFNDDIQLIHETTFYQKYGDYIPRIAALICIALLIVALYRRFFVKVY